MTHPVRNINSVVALMKTSYSRINQLNDSSLTALQRNSAEERLRNALSDEGITYHWLLGDDYVLFNFDSLYVEDNGVIIDVNVEGRHPIRLAAGEGVSIDFEPRDFRILDLQTKINNAEFMHLRKGAAFSFSGKVPWGRYFIPTGHVELHVDSQHRATLGKLLRRMLGL